jgi:hypothetical protein
MRNILEVGDYMRAGCVLQSRGCKTNLLINKIFLNFVFILNAGDDAWTRLRSGYVLRNKWILIST